MSTRSGTLKLNVKRLKYYLNDPIIYVKTEYKT